MTIRQGLRTVLLGLAFAFQLAGGLAQACPNCKEGLAESSDVNAQRLADGYSSSILLMMGMPLALAGAGTFWVVKAAKEGRFPEL